MNRLRALTALGGAALVLVGLLFHVSTRLDVVHVVIAAAATLAGRPIVLALVSLALWLLGVFGAGGWLSLDTSNNWLHLVLAVAVLGLALLVGGQDLADDLEGNLGGRLSAEV